MNHKVDAGYLASAMMSKLTCFEDFGRERMVWPEIAEISLCGSLGCGKLLLQTAIQELREMRMDKMKLEYEASNRASKASESETAGKKRASNRSWKEGHEGRDSDEDEEEDDNDDDDGGDGDDDDEYSAFDEVASRYQVVVLQSTKLAVPFYEKMGFIRIGAVSRYHDRSILPEVPHRHWTNRIEHVKRNSLFSYKTSNINISSQCRPLFFFLLKLY
jgi:hypothetical protein